MTFFAAIDHCGGDCFDLLNLFPYPLSYCNYILRSDEQSGDVKSMNGWFFALLIKFDIAAVLTVKISMLTMIFEEIILYGK
jgi:hypothetical protein